MSDQSEVKSSGRNRTVWAVERQGRRNTWSVSSIHYTRSAARRQKKRDLEAGLKARDRKYVPQDWYTKILDALQSRVADALSKFGNTNEQASSSSNAREPLPEDNATFVGSANTRAGTLSGASF